ncbi:MAG: zf-HC2 domain-containing protein [Planctomycetaceae bacterium]|nr:zf-HC2 domain-containing protein [Planctomycetaceae bacterium]
MANSHHPSDSQIEDQPWEPCARGTISRMVNTIKQHRRRRAMRDIGLAVGCLLLSLLLANEFLTTPDPDRLSHDQVVEMADEFIHGELSPAMAELVEEHINRCPRCEHLLEERDRYQGQSKLMLPDDSVVTIDVPERELLVATR